MTHILAGMCVDCRCWCRRSMSAPQGPELDLESAMVLDSLDLSARGSFSSADQTAEQVRFASPHATDDYK